MFHLTETILLGIHNDLILAMDRGEVTSLILLDLSAAFDTVDHSILLHRLQHWFGLHGTSLDWLFIYILSPHCFSGSLPPKFHFIYSHYLFLWCTSRFRPWPIIIIHSIITTPLGSLISLELNQIPPLC